LSVVAASCELRIDRKRRPRAESQLEFVTAVGPVKRLQILPVVIHGERAAAMPAVVE
jgi:hypothetical protein